MPSCFAADHIPRQSCSADQKQAFTHKHMLVRDMQCWHATQPCRVVTATMPGGWGSRMCLQETRGGLSMLLASLCTARQAPHPTDVQLLLAASLCRTDQHCNISMLQVVQQHVCLCAGTVQRAVLCHCVCFAATLPLGLVDNSVHVLAGLMHIAMCPQHNA
jgi:hypothetical protein